VLIVLELPDFSRYIESRDPGHSKTSHPLRQLIAAGVRQTGIPQPAMLSEFTTAAGNCGVAGDAKRQK
jgi:hypothetical protein